MTIQKQGNQELTNKSRDPDFVGAEAAMRRAAELARRRAIETSGSVAVFKDGKIVWDKEPTVPRSLSSIDPHSSNANETV